MKDIHGCGIFSGIDILFRDSKNNSFAAMGARVKAEGHFYFGGLNNLLYLWLKELNSYKYILIYIITIE
jgi:hypothetical protein